MEPQNEGFEKFREGANNEDVAQNERSNVGSMREEIYQLRAMLASQEEVRRQRERHQAISETLAISEEMGVQLRFERGNDEDEQRLVEYGQELVAQPEAVRTAFMGAFRISRIRTPPRASRVL